MLLGLPLLTSLLKLLLERHLALLKVLLGLKFLLHLLLLKLLLLLVSRPGCMTPIQQLVLFIVSRVMTIKTTALVSFAPPPDGLGLLGPLALLGPLPLT